MVIGTLREIPRLRSRTADSRLSMLGAAWVICRHEGHLGKIAGQGVAGDTHLIGKRMESRLWGKFLMLFSHFISRGAPRHR